MTDPRRVAVLGAGLAGATAARRLAQASLEVVVLDKGRGVGGRMAIRRVGEGVSFDHGAQFIHPRGQAFLDQIADWRSRGIVAPWGGHGRFVGTPSMTAPVRDLLAGLDVRTGTTVTSLTREAQGWRIVTGEGRVPELFSAVVIGFPSIQAKHLVEASGLELTGVDTAAYAPCWSLLLATDGPAPFAQTDRRGIGGAIATIVRDDTRPGRPPGTRLTVHAGPDWSRRHLEETKEVVAERLLGEAEACLGRPIVPTYAAAHRWRYALVETALGRDCLYDPGLRIGACGDWCLGPRIEAAFDSGSALAARVLADLG